MKFNKRNVFLYVLTVIVPVIIIGLYDYQYIIQQNNFERGNNASWIASIYEKNWDQFISETKTSLKILSFSAEEKQAKPQEIQPLLERVHHSDPRYGGLYLLDAKGKTLSSSDSDTPERDFSRLDYIKQVMKSTDTIVSNHQEVLDHQRILGLATPVLDVNNHLKAILVAYLRMDYMQNLMRVLTPDTKLYIVNGEKRPVLKMNVSKKDVINDGNWVSVPMDLVPWTIKVKIAPRNVKDIGNIFGKTLFLIIVVTHILFLIVEYMLLKRNTVRERKENEVQKIELVGTLAASTAHEIRNPLTGVKGLVQLLSEKYTAPEDRYYFDVINSELKRINEIVSEFLILGKPTAQISEKVNIAETLQELKALIISEGNTHNIGCKWQIPTDTIVVQCVKDQMKQVILNVTKNAFESMNSGGLLQVNLHHAGDFCKIEIIDNGKGISKDNLEKIFRPFYTSKETGTGLGLVICKRIINSFNGQIQINSTEFVGTTVEITLPILEKTEMTNESNQTNKRVY